MAEEDKKFIKDAFGVDCNRYNDDDLEKILNNILSILDNKINELTAKNTELEKRIYMLEQNI